MDKGYTLVICEKPDAARRVSDALSDGAATSTVVDGATVFRFTRRGEDFAVCSAQGHLYGVSDPCEERVVYPVFDVEWYQSNLVDEERSGSAAKVSAIKKLAGGASKFVNACDFDVEGETIGFNLLRYACGGKERGALRARFSTLTKEELAKAFDEARPQENPGLARAGRARHLVDFVWGVNLSRLLSQSTTRSGRRYRTVTVGRVQGPTLEFLVQREKEVREFVPVPYWKVTGTFAREGRRILAEYSKEKVPSKTEAQKVREECVGKKAVAIRVDRSVSQVGPPTPFDIGDLQKEAYRVFRLSPSMTLQSAERLYLAALISYPRTGSQRLPPSIGYSSIMNGLARSPAYAGAVAELTAHELKPVQGAKVDMAHPAIHPTGEKPARPLAGVDASVYDLIVRRFLASFGPSARRETVNVRLSVGGHEFRVAGGRTVSPGWAKYYGKYSWFKDAEVPSVSEGDEFEVTEVTTEEKFEQRPPRFNQGSLLDRMEKERIGTKATRAEIISTLVSRGYVTGESMEVSELGLSVSETMGRYSPSIITTELTRRIEEKLEAVESGQGGEPELLRETVREIADQLFELGAHEDDVGKALGEAAGKAVAAAYLLGPCPVCKTGQLKLITSKATKKRFVGCSNYASGCRASAPLPQRGTVKPTMKPCQTCSWPIVNIWTGRRYPWRLCVNPSCPTKVKKKA